MMGYRSQEHLQSDSLRVVFLSGRVDRMPRIRQTHLPNLEVVGLYGAVWLPHGPVEFAQGLAGARLESDGSLVLCTESYPPSEELEGESYDTSDELEGIPLPGL